MRVMSLGVVGAHWSPLDSPLHAPLTDMQTCMSVMLMFTARPGTDFNPLQPL